MCRRPRTYKGHILQSWSALKMFLGVRPSRLCMSDFEGSSRSTLEHELKNLGIDSNTVRHLLTMITSSLHTS